MNTAKIIFVGSVWMLYFYYKGDNKKNVQLGDDKVISTKKPPKKPIKPVFKNKPLPLSSMLPKNKPKKKTKTVLTTVANDIVHNHFVQKPHNNINSKVNDHHVRSQKEKEHVKNKPKLLPSRPVIHKTPVSESLFFNHQNYHTANTLGINHPMNFANQNVEAQSRL